MEDSSCYPFYISLGITVGDNTICYFTDDVIEGTSNYAGPYDIEYSWNFGSGASPATATGLGPHTVSYSTAGTKTVTLTATILGMSFEVSTTITVSTCLGQMVGTLKTDLGAAMAGYNLLLYNDANEDGVADGAAVRNIITNGSGGWAMASLSPGHYLLVANLTGATLISATDANDAGGGDGVVDTFTILPNNNAPGREAFKVQIRPGLVQGSINLIATIP